MEATRHEARSNPVYDARKDPGAGWKARALTRRPLQSYVPAGLRPMAGTRISGLFADPLVSGVVKVESEFSIQSG
jgi:hypothetical protein